MELDSSLQVSTEQLLTQKFDALIAVSSYESRSSHLITQMQFSAIPHKLVLAFNEKKDFLYRELNNKKFTELGFHFISASSGDASILPNILDELCNKIGKSSLQILIDYSSMPKIWYNELINYFSIQEEVLSSVHIWFSYSISEYTRSNSAVSNKYLDPVKPNSSSKKPIALILGLGYEKGRAESFAKLFNAQVTYAFCANSLIDNRYVEEVINNNKSVLQSIKQEQIMTYPINDLNSVNQMLTQLCIELRLTHQILLVPVGPKPFTLMCFILSMRYPDIKICKVSSIISTSVLDHRAQGELLIYKVTFTNEEVDY